MEIPITLKLKRKLHKDIAYAQDLVLKELYKVFPKAIIHGGTAIWRCYHGNRFSEDIDIYIPKNNKKIEELFENLKKIGFNTIKKRIKENSLYSTLSFNNTIIRLEAIFKKENIILKEYEDSEGILLNVYTLTPEKIIKEKIETYTKRKKIRDLYDIFFLLRYVKEENEIKKSLKNLITNFKQPEDEENLKTIIISGPIPSSKEILQYIKRWAK